MKRTEARIPFPDAPPHDELVDLAVWMRGLTTARHSGLAITERPACFAAQAPTLYLDTTIVSYLTARPSRTAMTAKWQAITRHWWHEHRARHQIYVSELVLKEARRGDSEAAGRRMEVLSTFPFVHPNAQSRELADRILRQYGLPVRVYEDAHHAAMAALNGLEVLLTWNCTHLANANMIPLIRRACEAYGYAPPAIYTPEQLIGVCAYGRSGS
jgi:predicted nucleic acid-binding protein